jgi:hypothetical protein
LFLPVFPFSAFPAGGHFPLVTAGFSLFRVFCRVSGLTSFFGYPTDVTLFVRVASLFPALFLISLPVLIKKFGFNKLLLYF